MKFIQITSFIFMCSIATTNVHAQTSTVPNCYLKIKKEYFQITTRHELLEENDNWDDDQIELQERYIRRLATTICDCDYAEEGDYDLALFITDKLDSDVEESDCEAIRDEAPYSVDYDIERFLEEDVSIGNRSDFREYLELDSFDAQEMIRDFINENN